MELNEYQHKAMTIAQYPHVGDNIVYPVLGMTGEAGEIANKVKKIQRGDYALTPEVRLDLAKEIGDVLWYCAVLAVEIGYELDDVAKYNLDKLKVRKENNTIKGSGDNR